ncbi:hypothetical protein I7I50_06983 [Histoplasma capsulatum G186AR]|uniref:Uncharacterized protein n=1 Tax=Ajellomyces capsulatus TaxID=5037 RepID=A0A8H7Z1T5_AJECA|nr:hypothetical protein I7I52_09944 [Histoplasma capsulatum]QSS67797.1 hypothetical protein I7I50_06983 [Histoplasma capsulatum G186AR]
MGVICLKTHYNCIAGKPRDKFFFHFAVQCLVWVVEQKHSNAMCTVCLKEGQRTVLHRERKWFY